MKEMLRKTCALLCSVLGVLVALYAFGVLSAVTLGTLHAAEAVWAFVWRGAFGAGLLLAAASAGVCLLGSLLFFIDRAQFLFPVSCVIGFICGLAGVCWSIFGSMADPAAIWFAHLDTALVLWFAGRLLWEHADKLKTPLEDLVQYA